MGHARGCLVGGCRRTTGGTQPASTICSMVDGHSKQSCVCYFHVIQKIVCLYTGPRTAVLLLPLLCIYTYAQFLFSVLSLPLPALLLLLLLFNPHDGGDSCRSSVAPRMENQNHLIFPLLSR